MGYKLCTAEKPSVARDIAKVIGANKRENGYFIGNGYIVTWAVGHLVGLAEPENYGFMGLSDIWDKERPHNKEKAMDELPLLPNEFKLTVLDGTKEQFDIVKNLMNRDDVDQIIDCGDMGAEGHILQWFIREMAGNTKPVLRFRATSMTEEAIREAMDNLVDANIYLPVIYGEFCKKKSDWILGMSISRCASIVYNSKVDVGRVQSPTLYFVVKRFIEVNNFKVTDYFQLRADFKEGYSFFWIKDANNAFKSTLKDGENRLLEKSAADKTAMEIQSLGYGIVTHLETKNRSIDRPQLYDITELERDGNRLYGYSPDEVLTIAQSLYEKHKVLSYPRTDSRYITNDLKTYMELRISEIGEIERYVDCCTKILSDGLLLDDRVVNDNKVTDHHALIVTEKIKGFDMESLSEKEYKILHLVITRMIVSFSRKHLYKETLASVSFSNGFEFHSKGSSPVSIGWKWVHHTLMGKMDGDEDKAEREQVFKDIKQGQKLNIDKIIVLPKKTTPPKLHTEATLLTAMENAGSQISNGEILKGKGIGTQATRASIIKALFEKGYVKYAKKGKTNYVIPTRQGINVIKVLPTELYSPSITADWEERISKIVNGDLTEEQFMNDFEVFIRKKIVEIRDNRREDVDFSFEREVFGKCPFCKSNVFEGEFVDKEKKKHKLVYCENKECKFSIYYDNIAFVMRTNKNLTVNQMYKLVTDGKISATCKSKNGSKYKGVFNIVRSDRGYANLTFSFK